jgi:hypothetical protein
MTAALMLLAFVIGFYFGRRWERRGDGFVSRLYGKKTQD